MNSLHSKLYHASLSSTYFKEQRNSRNTNIYNISYIMLPSKPKNGISLGAVSSNSLKGESLPEFPKNNLNSLIHCKQIHIFYICKLKSNSFFGVMRGK